MAAKRSAQTPHADTARRKKARADLASALLSATTRCGLSQEGAARAIGVAKSTIGRWARCKVEMNVEAVLATPRLGEAFKRALCTEHHDPLPYVARKRRNV